MPFKKELDRNSFFTLQLKAESFEGFNPRLGGLVFLGRLFPSLELSFQLRETLIELLPQKRLEDLAEEIFSLDLGRVRIMPGDFYRVEDFSEHFEILGSSLRGERHLRRLIAEAINLSLGDTCLSYEGILAQINELREIYFLDEVEIEAILFLYVLSENSEFSFLLSESNYWESVELFSKALNVEPFKILSVFSDKGRLVSNGLIELRRPNRFPSLMPVIKDWFSGRSPKGLSEKHIRRDQGKPYSLKSFNLPDLRLKMMQGLLGTRTSCNILLYGGAGTGKTEFARSLAASQSRRVFFFVLDTAVSFGSDLHRAELIAAHERVSRENGILIIDEADNILQPAKTAFSFGIGYRATEGLGKEWLNSFLDNSKCRTIWITNRIGMLDPSVKRRFDFSLRFRELDRKRRLEMWKLKLREEKVRLPGSVVKRFAAAYPVNSGLIASALKSSSPFKDDPKTLIAKLEEILERQLELHGLKKSLDLSKTCQSYDPSALCLDTERLVFEDSLLGFVKQLESDKKVGGLNLLFWGPSGTGKTEYARYLAGLVGRELIVKRASDLQNCYLGETEKAIRAAFQEASAGSGILFIDEADSFLYTRDRSRESWEITAVNEFLTSMESFNGILICCTNFFSEFDKASLRRFQWKIGFKPLEAEGRVSLFRKYFSPRKKLAPDLVARLEGMDGLVPGDFKAVSDRLSFAKSGRPIWELALDELAKEVELRRKKRERVGFLIGEDHDRGFNERSRRVRRFATGQTRKFK